MFQESVWENDDDEDDDDDDDDYDDDDDDDNDDFDEGFKDCDDIEQSELKNERAILTSEIHISSPLTFESFFTHLWSDVR